MTSKAKSLLNKALQLSPAERKALAAQLFDSLEPEDFGTHAAWEAVIKRRIEDVEQGRVKPMSWAEAKDFIRGGKDDSGRG